MRSHLEQHSFSSPSTVCTDFSFLWRVTHSLTLAQANLTLWKCLQMWNLMLRARARARGERECVCISIKLISLKSDENTSTNYGKWSFYSFMSMYKKFIEHHIFAETQTKQKNNEKLRRTKSDVNNNNEERRKLSFVCLSFININTCTATNTVHEIN